MDAWRTWLSALADPRCALAVTVANRMRTGRWDMGRRVLPDHMLHAIEAGGQEGTVDGRPLRTRAGDLLWLPPGCAQELRLAAGERVLCKIYLRFTLHRAGRVVPWPAGQPATRRLPGAAALLGQAVVEALHPGPDAATRLRALLTLLFSDWYRAAATAGGLAEERRRQVAALLAEDPARRWTPAALAAELGLSPLTLTRQIRAASGLPLRRFLVESRLRAAAADLGEGGTVGEVARRHGWRDPFLFSRLFARRFGAAPSAWRHPRPATAPVRRS